MKLEAYKATTNRGRFDVSTFAWRTVVLNCSREPISPQRAEWEALWSPVRATMPTSELARESDYCSGSILSRSGEILASIWRSVESFPPIVAGRINSLLGAMFYSGSCVHRVSSETSPLRLVILTTSIFRIQAIA